ncbi:MAG: substrate-binding domain-containing protein [Oscillospiraceae bacterium]|nr:substrate-binding domain-containing protein [Oscillospiraceae bacterium]
MKKIVSLILALVMIFALAACGQSAAPTTTEAPAPAEEPASEAQTAETEPEQPEEPEVDALLVDTCILMEADDAMINNYSLLAVNPEAPFVDADGKPVDDVELNTVGAAALINWLLSEEGQELAANFGYEEYGEYLFYLKDGRPVSTAEIPEATEETRLIRLSTTTSVNDSGLLGYLLPIFEEKYGYEVEVYSAGTGKSIGNAKMGNADLILVHSKSQEEAFVADGFAYVLDGMPGERLTWMYNYFVLCGPSADPAGVKEAPDVKAAFAAIADGKYSFISRGDGSGTHTKELSLWPEELGISAEPESFKDYADWYISANAGMGACLVMAEEMGAYILTDKATFLTFVANDGKIG